jgi:hypothetical protein
MGYQSLIDSNLKKAFLLAKDLAVDVVLTKKTNDSFNFGTGEVSSPSSQTVSTKAIIIDSKKTSADRNSVSKEIMLKAKDVGDLKSYSTITIDSVIWTLSGVQKNDGFILLGNITKEV